MWSRLSNLGLKRYILNEQPGSITQHYARVASNACEGVQRNIRSSCKKPVQRQQASFIEVTSAAASKIKEFIKSDGKNPHEYGLQLAVVRSGCSGNAFDMSLAQISKAQQQGDDILDQEGAKVMIAQKDSLALFGARLDYEESLFARGLKLKTLMSGNPVLVEYSFILKKEARQRR